MQLNQTSNSIDIQTYIRSPLHHTRDGRSEDGLPNVPMRMTVTQYAPADGATHIPAPDYTRADWRGGMLSRLHGHRRTRGLRGLISLAVLLAALFAATALTSETLRATVTACGAC